MEKEKQVKKMNVPHIFIIILCIILLACLATYVAPPGVYDMDETGSAIAGSYHLVEREPVSPWAALLMIKKGIESAGIRDQPAAGCRRLHRRAAGYRGV